MPQRSCPLRHAFIVTAIAWLVAAASTARAGDLEENKALFMKFVDEVMNKGNMELVDELLAPGFVEHEEMPTDLPEGREGLKVFLTMFRGAFPDLKVTVHDLIAEGDKVVARQTWRGTNEGEFMGMPATGRTVEFNVIDVLRIEDGKAVEHWGVTDQSAMMRQLHPEAMMKAMPKPKD